MKLPTCQVFIASFALLSQATPAFDFSRHIDEVFLSRRPTLEESRAILTDARLTYRLLRTCQPNSNNTERVLKKLGGFAACVLRDLETRGTDLPSFFRNMSHYLKDDTVGYVVDRAVLSRSIQAVIAETDRKLASYRARTHRKRHNTELILSRDDNIFGDDCESSEVNASSVGFFFVEVFASLIGLTWGLISMILADFDE